MSSISEASSGTSTTRTSPSALTSMANAKNGQHATSLWARSTTAVSSQLGSKWSSSRVGETRSVRATPQSINFRHSSSCDRAAPGANEQAMGVSISMTIFSCAERPDMPPIAGFVRGAGAQIAPGVLALAHDGDQTELQPSQSGRNRHGCNRCLLPTPGIDDPRNGPRVGIAPPHCRAVCRHRSGLRQRGVRTRLGHGKGDASPTCRRARIRSTYTRRRGRALSRGDICWICRRAAAL